MLNFTNFELQDAKGIASKACPLPIVCCALSPIAPLLLKLEQGHQEDRAGEIISLIRHRLDNLADIEIRTLDRQVLSRTIRVMADFIGQVQPDEVYKMSE